MKVTFALQNWQWFLLGVSVGMFTLLIWAEIMVKYIYPRKDKKVEKEIAEIGKE